MVMRAGWNAGCSRAYRDIDGGDRGRGAARGVRGYAVDTVTAVQRITDCEAFSLGIDNIDIGPVDRAELVSPFRIGITRDLHSVGFIRRRYIEGQSNIRRRP